MNTKLPANITLGPVALSVSDLERSLDYYQEHIGLRLLARNGRSAQLGTNTAPLLILSEKQGATIAPRTTGLYHFAILVPSRLELAKTLHHLAQTHTPFTGFADHSVSEALYLSDPDGHGIEIYRDRPRHEWHYDANGQLHMTTDPLDTDSILAELTGEPEWNGLHPDTTIGHIHLHISHVEAAERFYCEVIGFDPVLRYGPSASFIAAGGYHHHLGLNTWAGVGIPPAPETALRLEWYGLHVPDSDSLSQLRQRLDHQAIPYTINDNSVHLTDPAGNRLRISG